MQGSESLEVLPPPLAGPLRGSGCAKTRSAAPAWPRPLVNSRSLAHHTTGSAQPLARGVQSMKNAVAPMGTVPARAPTHFAHPDPSASGSAALSYSFLAAFINELWQIDYSRRI